VEHRLRRDDDDDARACGLEPVIASDGVRASRGPNSSRAGAWGARSRSFCVRRRSIAWMTKLVRHRPGDPPGLDREPPLLRPRSTSMRVAYVRASSVPRRSRAARG